MIGRALRSKQRGRPASGTKGKKTGESSERARTEGQEADDDSDNDATFNADDEAGASTSEHATGEDSNDKGDAGKQRRRSSHQKSKGGQAARGSAKRGRGARNTEQDDDESESSGSGSGGNLKVERHAKVVRRAKRKLRDEKKQLRAKGAKVVPTLGVSESSTEGGSGPGQVYLPEKKGQSFEEGRDRAGRRVARAMNKSVLDREASYPPRTAQEFKNRIPTPQYDEYWSRADQAELVARLSDDSDFKKRQEVPSFVITVWKTAFRFTGRLATDIIGPGTGLEFRSDSHKGWSPVWTQRFCEALIPIILHPLLGLNTQKMALALQWAVVCRTGYQSRYRLSGCGDDLSLRALASTVEAHQDGSMAPAELLEAAKALYERPYGENAYPSIWLQFLSRIENKVVRGSADATRADDADGGPFFVNTTDLYAVRSALDRVKHLDLRMFADTRQVVDAVMPTRNKVDVPSVAHAKQAIKAVLLQKERNKERVRRGGRPEPSAAPGWVPDCPSEDQPVQEDTPGGEEAAGDSDPLDVEDSPVAPKTRRGKQGAIRRGKAARKPDPKGEDARVVEDTESSQTLGDDSY
ncbi:hypothetical protein KVR01_004725 [Diaporthe batatas]|uniref:uncharacterized protein n=1 Tax=Diaporthe batatas TaxID=748121 RepID=UPI001D04A123|nr:uncharacterized protein KVR01_004725 [Diaporthe batatas]KAG8166173.1 hypothetical protein KVR01_004725 [Diaporthe batatas]